MLAPDAGQKGGQPRAQGAIGIVDDRVAMQAGSLADARRPVRWVNNWKLTHITVLIYCYSHSL
jgi:hypothetical protein